MITGAFRRLFFMLWIGCIKLPVASLQVDTHTVDHGTGR